MEIIEVNAIFLPCKLCFILFLIFIVHYTNIIIIIDIKDLILESLGVPIERHGMFLPKEFPTLRDFQFRIPLT